MRLRASFRRPSGCPCPWVCQATLAGGCAWDPLPPGGHGAKRDFGSLPRSLYDWRVFKGDFRSLDGSLETRKSRVCNEFKTLACDTMRKLRRHVNGVYHFAKDCHF